MIENFTQRQTVSNHIDEIERTIKSIIHLYHKDVISENEYNTTYKILSDKQNKLFEELSVFDRKMFRK